jgi:multiple sugar transport system permease protein
MRMVRATGRYFICSFNQSNYAAALAITMAVITMAIAYAVQLNSMKEQMR